MQFFETVYDEFIDTLFFGYWLLIYRGMLDFNSWKEWRSYNAQGY